MLLSLSFIDVVFYYIVLCIVLCIVLYYIYIILQGDDPELSERALDGLTQVMIVKSRVVLPYLVPQVYFLYFHPLGIVSKRILNHNELYCMFVTSRNMLSK